ncbi:MAG TPA: VWA domain-containing protein [Bacteroidales bacterium]|nr:MAG: von Willebrand factor type A domain protein [Bacteroidetes bacterium ADurb.Bin139]HOG25167.1 VWA domain-containing protein [Bacteroidales bacterium]HOR11498.1 VWA domain-containing protein [Bacteroidales bacterium]HOZ19505.1 VWA domain-containing protein [Bacteroidales bacterium]HPB78186.1 VWA domain-containing protein [Bacteroidales bacterium]
MEKKHQVHNLIILDESGSMNSIKKYVISGFNETVQTIRGIEKKFPEQEHFITFLTFNGLGLKQLHFADPVKELKRINSQTYNPAADTPLYDAMGYAITKLKLHLMNKTDYNVLVTIFTDGEENASEEYSAQAIKKLVGELKQEHWTFTYIGTDHDVLNAGTSISITNTITFNKNEEGVKELFLREKKARFNYSQRIRDKVETGENYYNEQEEEPS